MRTWHLTVAAVVIVVGAFAVTTTAQQRAAESRDMTLLGSNDLQARSAYQPVIQKQGNRYIAYIGHHAGSMPNLLTGKMEDNGTSVVGRHQSPPAEIHRAHSGRRRSAGPRSGTDGAHAAAAQTCRRPTRASSICSVRSAPPAMKSGT